MSRFQKVIDAEGFLETLEGLIDDPPIEFNSESFEGEESYEECTDIFMEGYNAGLEIVVDMVKTILSIERIENFTS